MDAQDGATGVVVHGLRLEREPTATTGRLLALLSVDERDRAATMQGLARHHFVHGRALLRSVLASRTGTDPARLSLANGPNGKPALARPEGAPAFNVAHSAGHVVAAVADVEAVGVDVEPVRPVPARVARRALGAATMDELATLRPEDRDIAVIHHWVVREACAKALALTVAAVPSMSSSTRDTGRHADLRWDVVTPWPGVMVAVATRPSGGAGAPPTVQLLPPAALLRGSGAA